MTKSLPPKYLVLYADDDLDDITFVKDAFEEYSSLIDVVAFKDGAELLHYLEKPVPFQPQPCLIILDVNMPGLDGKQTLQKLRALDHFKTIPVVLFTTSTLPSEMVFARSYGAGFVTKPLHARQVNLIAEQFIEHCTDEMKERFKTYGSR